MEQGRALQLGTALGRYQLIDEVGRGGIGVVYRAYEPVLDRTVALKVLAPQLADQPRFVQQLRREAISAARLRHPHIAILYEFGSADDTAFLAMEFVSGTPLRRLLIQGKLTQEQALSVLMQIAGALDYAHSLGVVHRDVKPGNILVGPNNHATLIDFGIAELAEELDRTGEVERLGTPHYMAPEQAAGHEVEAASDQYALAAVAYELLTGTPPFHGRSATAIVHAHLYEPPPPPTERRPALPEAVNAVLLRGLAKQPEARYSSAAALVDALAAALRPASAPKRRWLPIAAAVALTLALLGGLLWTQRPTETTANFPTARRSALLPQRVVWLYDPGLAGQSVPLATADAVIFTTLEGNLVALDPRSGTVRWALDGARDPYSAPGGGAGQLFIGTAAGALLCLDPDTGAVRWRQQLSGAVRDAPLRVNDWVVATTDQGFVYRLATGDGTVLWQQQVGIAPHAATVGSGQIFVLDDSIVTALNWQTGGVTWRFRALGDQLTPPVTGNQLVIVGSDHGVVYGLNAADGREQRRFQARGALSAAPAVDADRLYIADGSGTITAISGDRWDTEWTFETRTAITATPLLAEDKLVFGTSGGTIYTLDARSGRDLAVIQLDQSVSTSPVIGPDYVYVRARRIYALGG